MKTLIGRTRRVAGASARSRSRRAGSRRRRQGGFTLIEALVASLIMAVSVSAMVSLFYFAFNMTMKADSQGVAYTIGRREMEQVKLAGFEFAPDGTTTPGYDKYGNPATGQDVVFRATTIIVTKNDPGSSAGSYASHRIVNITVVAVKNSRDILYRSGTHLAKAGI